MSAVKPSEVMAKFVDLGFAADDARRTLLAFGLTIRPFDEEQALTAGLLRSATRKRGLSLGDRACLIPGRARTSPSPYCRPGLGRARPRYRRSVDPMTRGAVRSNAVFRAMHLQACQAAAGRPRVARPASCIDRFRLTVAVPSAGCLREGAKSYAWRAARSRSHWGLALSPWRVFPHECCRCPRGSAAVEGESRPARLSHNSLWTKPLRGRR